MYSNIRKRSDILNRYVEWLENERKILSLGVREACRRLIEANLWPRESLPRVGRLLSMHDMLVGLELIQDSNDTNLEVERSGRKAPDRKEKGSPLGTKYAPGKRALDLHSYRNIHAAASPSHDLPHGESFRPRTTDSNLPSSQSTATALASLLGDTSLARHSWSNAAFRMSQHPQIVNLGQDSQLWVQTTDAYQEISGPSNSGTRTIPIQPRTEGVHQLANASRHDPEQPSGTWEAMTSEQDETPPDIDGDRSEYIKIPF
jgi:hypothetical protein